VLNVGSSQAVILIAQELKVPTSKGEPASPTYNVHVPFIVSEYKLEKVDGGVATEPGAGVKLHSAGQEMLEPALPNASALTVPEPLKLIVCPTQLSLFPLPAPSLPSSAVSTTPGRLIKPKTVPLGETNFTTRSPTKV